MFRPVIIRCAALLCIAIFSSSGCSDTSQNPRRGWLQATIIDDNRVDLERDPTRVAQKFAKMASDPYLYFRGTNAQFFRDISGQTQPSYPISLNGAPPPILLVGDPHPENIGTFLSPDDRLVVEFNDFDAATHGPFYADVRRAALGLWLAAQPLDDSPSPDGIAAVTVRAFAQRYADEIARLSAGGAPQPITRTSSGGIILDDLFRRARRDGDAREALDEYTRVDRGERLMFVGVVEPPSPHGFIGDEVRALDAEALAQVTSLVRAYRHTALLRPENPDLFWALKGATRRLGAGVSSYPVLRYYALVEGPSAAIEDDLLLELKEIRDPPATPNLPRWPADYFDNNAQRGVVSQRQLHLRPDADSLLGWAGSSSQSFRVRWRTKYQKGVDVARVQDKILSGEWPSDALVDLATTLGDLLARAHFRATTPSGALAGPAIAASLPSSFAPDISGFATSYGAQTLDDFLAFVTLLDDAGPTLGWPLGAQITSAP